jgi:hypothetical protein
MNPYQASSQSRTTVTVPRLALSLNGVEAINTAPFLVRAKFSYEPELKPLEDDPGAPEWFAFDCLYAYENVSFLTGDGVAVLVKPCHDLLMLLTEQQLQIIEDIVMADMQTEVDNYEPLLDFLYGI